MSLRKSPTRTPALLAANRANAQKSTGPRTPEGKSRVALNALRHGLRARSFFTHLVKSRRVREELSALYRALYTALLPDETAIDVLKRTVLHVWAMKQEAMRWAASSKEREAWFAQTEGCVRLQRNCSSSAQGGGCGFRSGCAGEGAGAATGRSRVLDGKSDGRGCMSW